jgi:uncharacterized membrane protein
VAEGWEPALTRWAEAGIIDEATAARIRAFEKTKSPSAGFPWTIWLALGFGAVLLAAGVLLFVSAY